MKTYYEFKKAVDEAEAAATLQQRPPHFSTESGGGNAVAKRCPNMVPQSVAVRPSVVSLVGPSWSDGEGSAPRSFLRTPVVEMLR